MWLLVSGSETRPLTREHRADAPHRSTFTRLLSEPRPERRQSRSGDRRHRCRVHLPPDVWALRISRRLRQAFFPYQKLIRDASQAAARVSRAAGRVVEASACVRRPAGGPTWQLSRLKGFRPSAPIRRGRSATNGRPSAGLGDQLSRRTVRPVAARVGARHSGTEPGAPADSGAERRDTSPSARGTTLHVSIWNIPKRSAAAASPRCACRRTMAGRIGWWGQMLHKHRCLDTEAQRHRGLNAGTPGHRGLAEKMHFSVGCVSGLCGGASSSPAAKRPASRETTDVNTRPARNPTVLHFRL